jgi:hypothetical protein
MEPPPPDGERVLSIVTARLLAMPASAFATSTDAAVPPVLPTDELREALRSVAARSAQAAAVARLARVSRGSNQLAEASALPAPERVARREKHAALRGVCAAPRAAALLRTSRVQDALLAACTRAEAAAAPEAAHWRRVAAAAQRTLADEDDGRLLVTYMMAGEASAHFPRGQPLPEWDDMVQHIRVQRLTEALAGR